MYKIIFALILALAFIGCDGEDQATNAITIFDSNHEIFQLIEEDIGAARETYLGRSILVQGIISENYGFGHIADISIFIGDKKIVIDTKRRSNSRPGNYRSFIGVIYDLREEPELNEGGAFGHITIKEI